MPLRSGSFVKSTTRNSALRPSRSATFHPPPERRATAASLRTSQASLGARAGRSGCRLAFAAVSREHVGMRITMNDGVGLAVEVAGDGPGLLLLHGLGGAKEDFADHVPTLARDHTVVTFDHRGHGESDNPTDPARIRSSGSSPTRWPSPTRPVSSTSGCSAIRWAGWSRARSRFRSRHAVDALVMMDTSAGSDPRLRSRARSTSGRRRAHAGQAGVEGPARLRRARWRRRRTSASPPSVRATPSSRRASGPACRRSCGARWPHELAHQTDDLPAMAARRFPALDPRGRREDKPFVIASQTRWPKRFRARSSS